MLRAVFCYSERDASLRLTVVSHIRNHISRWCVNVRMRNILVYLP